MISNERLKEIERHRGTVDSCLSTPEANEMARRLLELEEANRSKAGKCLECGAPIEPTHVGLCHQCFRKWLREIDALPIPPATEQLAQEVKP